MKSHKKFSVALQKCLRWMTKSKNQTLTFLKEFHQNREEFTLKITPDKYN